MTPEYIYILKFKTENKPEKQTIHCFRHLSSAREEAFKSIQFFVETQTNSALKLFCESWLNSFKDENGRFKKFRDYYTLNDFEKLTDGKLKFWIEKRLLR